MCYELQNDYQHGKKAKVLKIATIQQTTQNIFFAHTDGVLAPWSAHTRPSSQPHIGMSRNSPAHVLGGRGEFFRTSGPSSFRATAVQINFPSVQSTIDHY